MQIPTFTAGIDINEIHMDSDKNDLYVLSPGMLDERFQPGRLGILALNLDGHLLDSISVCKIPPGRMEH